MNKTVNINIGGLFFHIDEDAFQKLSRYFDAIKRSLSNSTGQDEIMKDIEMRVAELFTDKQKSDKHVINTKDVDEVVTVMGQPEDYRIDDTEGNSTNTNFSTRKNRKLYRDKDNSVIGGVCTGLGHYFGIDAIWIKIIFLIFLFAGFGTGIIAYFILWIVMPEAKTTTEKLEMTGEPINISNIEKKVRAEFDNLSDKIKSTDYDELGNKIKNTGRDIGDLIITVFKGFAKVLGAFIVAISAFLIVVVCIIAVATLTKNIMGIGPSANFDGSLESGIPHWLQGLLFLLAFGIPLFFFLILGLKLLVTNLKSIGNIAKYSLLGIWIIAVGILFSVGINVARQFSSQDKVVQKQTITINPTDTLRVKFRNNDYFGKENKNNDDDDDFNGFVASFGEDFNNSKGVRTDEKGRKIIYSNNVSIEILKTDEALPYLQIEKIARGISILDAKKRAENIEYGFKIEGNTLILDNYLLSAISNKFRGQHVEIFLYLPKGTLLQPDSSVQDYDQSDNEFFNLHYSSDNYIYKVESDKIKCLNCPKNENEYNDVDDDDDDVNNDSDTNDDDETITTVDSTASITVNKNGVIIKEKGKKPKEIVKINKHGITVKTE